MNENLMMETLQRCDSRRKTDVGEGIQRRIDKLTELKEGKLEGSLASQAESEYSVSVTVTGTVTQDETPAGNWKR